MVRKYTASSLSYFVQKREDKFLSVFVPCQRDTLQIEPCEFKDLKLVGLKSYDCHVLMQQLLVVAIRDILPNKVRHAITQLCFFFNAICIKVIGINKFDEQENGAAIILCQLEMYFPPFFNIMVHLIVHLVREIKCCGLVYL